MLKVVTRKTASALKKLEEITHLPIKTSALIALIGLVIFGLLITLLVELSSPGCSENYRDDEDISVHNQVLQVEVAKTQAELAKGLGGKSCIGDGQAMLFPFGRAADYSFWMKDMKFPIDMIWIDSEHKVVQIDSNVSPKSYPKTYDSSQPAQYVLEMEAGLAQDLNIKAGTLINI